MPADLRRLGAILRGERLQRQLSQEGLAALAGLSRTQLGEIERGAANISFASLMAIADGLEMQLSEIVARYEHELHSSTKARR